MEAQQKQHMPFATFYGIMEKHAIPVSFKGLCNDYAFYLGFLRDYYLKQESYLDLSVMDEKTEQVGKKYIFFVKWDEERKEYFHIAMLRKEMYSPVEYELAFQRVGVTPVYLETIDWPK